MIKNTFSILNGVGEKLEKKLWQSGVLSWEDFLDAPGLDFISPPRKALYDNGLSAASSRLDELDAAYFRRLLKAREHWRLFEAFRGHALCMDIETNGLPAGLGGYATVVGLYDGFDYRCLVAGRDLDARNLMDALSGYRYLITFFGSAFDVPFLEKTVPGLGLEMLHFDLCFAARRLGMRGGLKRIEVTLGVERDEATRGMDGYDAVLLWEKSRRGSDEALDLLVKYNMEDTVNLMGIADTVYSGLKSSTGIEEYLNGSS